MDTTISTIVPLFSKSNHNKSSELIFRLRQQVQLKRDIHLEIPTLTAVDVDITTMIPSYSVRLKNGFTKSVTEEYLTHLNEVRPSFIPIICAAVKATDNYINPETIKALLNAKSPTPLLVEFLNLYGILGHMSFVIMFRLYPCGRLPSKFLALQKISLLLL